MWLSGHLDVELEQLQRLAGRCVDDMMLGDGCHIVYKLISALAKRNF
jgi:hypothetical protein